MKFGNELTTELTKVLPELVINNSIKINSLKEQAILVRLSRTPFEADDQEITHYLEKFGTLKGPIRRRTYTDGPLKGLENGSITALITLTRTLPSYHSLRGKKFEAYHRGMNKTCYWCLEPGNKCENFIMGNGNACRKSGTTRGNFSQYISKLWADI